jgi:hypothetical protein
MLASAAALSVMPAARGALGGVALTTATLAALGLSRGGFSVNHMDIAPKYAGVLMGISNTAGRAARGAEGGGLSRACALGGLCGRLRACVATAGGRALPEAITRRAAERRQLRPLAVGIGGASQPPDVTTQPNPPKGTPNRDCPNKNSKPKPPDQDQQTQNRQTKTSKPPGTLSGVIGVAVTGRILDAAGGASQRAGWYSAHAVAAGICLKAALLFAAFARGERLFD